jgi:hypothetical protein
MREKAELAPEPRKTKENEVASMAAAVQERPGGLFFIDSPWPGKVDEG